MEFGGLNLTTFFIFVVSLAFFFIEVLILQYVWNNVMPDVFPSVRKIDFKHAILLMIVTNILFPHRFYTEVCKAIGK